MATSTPATALQKGPLGPVGDALGFGRCESDWVSQVGWASLDGASLDPLTPWPRPHSRFTSLAVLRHPAGSPDAVSDGRAARAARASVGSRIFEAGFRLARPWVPTWRCGSDGRR
jgi:hypothetical protein